MIKQCVFFFPLNITTDCYFLSSNSLVKSIICYHQNINITIPAFWSCFHVLDGATDTCGVFFEHLPVADIRYQTKLLWFPIKINHNTSLSKYPHLSPSIYCPFSLILFLENMSRLSPRCINILLPENANQINSNRFLLHINATHFFWTEWCGFSTEQVFLPTKWITICPISLLIWVQIHASKLLSLHCFVGMAPYSSEYSTLFWSSTDLPSKLNNHYFWFVYDLGQKYHAPQVRPNRGSNSWSPHHDSAVHVTETPVLTTRPSTMQDSTWYRISCFSVFIYWAVSEGFLLAYHNKLQLHIFYYATGIVQYISFVLYFVFSFLCTIT